MVTKKELVAEMKKAGVENISAGMTVKELKSIYDKHKKKKEAEEKGKEKLEEVKEERKENLENRETPTIKKGVFQLPKNAKNISPRDILAEKIVDGVHTIVFKQGAKVKYNAETGERIF